MSWRCWILLSYFRCVLLFHFLCRLCVWAWRFKCASHSFVHCMHKYMWIVFGSLFLLLFAICLLEGAQDSRSLSPALLFAVIGMNYVTLNIINNIVKWVLFLFALPERLKKYQQKIVLFTRHRFGCAIFHVSLMCKQNVCITARHGTAQGHRQLYENFRYTFLYFSLPRKI